MENADPGDLDDVAKEANVVCLVARGPETVG
jgi:hypothetical protein